MTGHHGPHSYCVPETTASGDTAPSSFTKILNVGCQVCIHHVSSKRPWVNFKDN